MNNGMSEEVARRAYELFLSRGGRHGRDVDDWLEAERQVARNSTTLPRRSRRSASNTGAAKTTVRRRIR
jgi:hypothetical protein